MVAEILSALAKTKGCDSVTCPVAVVELFLRLNVVVPLLCTFATTITALVAEASSNQPEPIAGYPVKVAAAVTGKLKK